MRRIILGLILAFGSTTGIGQTVILECGQNSGNSFNGWFITPNQVFDDITFDANGISFFTAAGGNFAVTITRKIEALASFDFLNILFNFEDTENCEIENVCYYVSKDGTHWEGITNGRNDRSVRVNNVDHDYIYVRAVANTRFFNNGVLTCDYFKVEGEPTQKNTLALIEPTSVDDLDSFYIFSFEHTLNIETQKEGPFEILITSISGQIVFRDNFTGSSRIDLPQELTGVFVVTVIQENAFQASKKIML